MTFDLHIHGETPAELLDALAHLGGTTNIITPAPQAQNEPVDQPDKPKAPEPAKQKKATQKPAATPAEEPENPTTAEASGLSSQADTAPATSTSAPESAPASEPDRAAENKIRTLVMELMNQGKRAECQKIIKSTGAKGISSLPPDSYTDVWQQLNKLKDEVNADAAG